MTTKTRFITVVLIGLVTLIILLAGIKVLQIRKMVAVDAAMVFPPTSVTSYEAQVQEWQPLIRAVGTVTAVQGVEVNAEVSGKVKAIRFESGSAVQAGAVLLELSHTTEDAQLRSAEATANLAQIDFKRAKTLLASNTISQAELDSAEALAAKAAADADNLRALIAKKTIRAPFAGVLGIRRVNLGEYIAAGAPIVSLQSMDPVYVSFYIPQQELVGVRDGLRVEVSSDARPGERFDGEVTAIASEVDLATRNIEIQATLPNPDGILRPGMFVDVRLLQSEKRKVVTVPATSILYASFGNSVYVLEKAEKGEGLVAQQRIVRLGEARGDFVEIISGVEAGEQVVSEGAFKLRQGSPVTVKNERALKPELNPQPENS